MQYAQNVRQHIITGDLRQLLVELMIQRHHFYSIALLTGGFDLLIKIRQLGDLGGRNSLARQPHTQHFIGQTYFNQFQRIIHRKRRNHHPFTRDHL
ncbi:hypothetical protein D3C86_1841520 [compost metagenome]